MSRFIRRSAMALPVLLIAPVTAAALALPAQAALGLAVNSAGSAIVTWVEPARTIMAASGTILGGFGAASLASAVTFVAAVDTSSGPSVRTSLPGGSFGTATALPTTAPPTALVIDPGHAVLIASGSVFTEP